LLNLLDSFASALAFSQGSLGLPDAQVLRVAGEVVATFLGDFVGGSRPDHADLGHVGWLAAVVGFELGLGDPGLAFNFVFADVLGVAAQAGAGLFVGLLGREDA
jgi:hypothetical protein